MVSYCDAAVKLRWIQNKEATHLSCHGRRDVGEVTDWSLCTEDMEVTDPSREEGRNNIMLLCYVPVISTEKKINTGGYTSGDPVHFSWNNRRKLLDKGRQEKHRSLHVQLRGTWVAAIGHFNFL